MWVTVHTLHTLGRSIPQKHPVQTMAVAYWTFHYAKRIFETFFVHRHAPCRSVACQHACTLPSFVGAPLGLLTQCVR